MFYYIIDIFVGTLDEALHYIKKLEARLQKLSLETPVIVNSFCVSDHTIR